MEPTKFDMKYAAVRRAIIEGYFAHLNDRQREAVFTTEGPLLILAGAGSGKTRVLTERIMRQVARPGGADIDEFLVITFTKAAAAELKGRISDSLAALAAGVLGTTGVESGVLVQAVVDKLHPSCVIAVDALASRSVERLCRTVQLSDVGIVPGSGVGNHRYALSRDTLGVPVLSLGVPTVVDGATLIQDLLGERAPEEIPGRDLFVTPREADSRVADLSRVLGYAVSLALNPSLSVEELNMLVE